eukprot:CAMPEP_0119319748 /NCGR_PEP_ID=MMETSP1333-20130426/50249_1 /TAXON_ID=418940 /ORGANISM="Scyphosphaera apsteinii, Strain RCC1455" /LENGTH=160 /DNA_ID=CAMNT_0007326237 /DNA_START=132 /DNA_END=614 /DNA_ORIENTATION=-
MVATHSAAAADAAAAMATSTAKAKIAWSHRTNSASKPSLVSLGRAAIVKADSIDQLRAAATTAQNLTVCKFVTRNCRACKMIEDKFERLAGGNLQMRFVEVRVERTTEGAAFCREFGLSKLPSIQVFDGEQRILVVGAVTRDSFSLVEARLLKLIRDRHI